MFLIWAVCVVVASSLYVFLYNFIDAWPIRGWPEPSKLRCPECGGKYRPGVAIYPPRPPFVDPPPKPRFFTRDPGAWKLTCESCGLQVFYGQWSKVLRTTREPPSGG